MPCKILDNVLPLSVGMGKWFLSNSCAVLSSATTVCICVFYADGDRVAKADWTADLMRAKLSYDNRALSHVQLHAMGIDS